MMGPGMFDGMIEGIFMAGIAVGIAAAGALIGLYYFGGWLFSHLQWVN